MGLILDIFAEKAHTGQNFVHRARSDFFRKITDNFSDDGMLKHVMFMQKILIGIYSNSFVQG